MIQSLGSIVCGAKVFFLHPNKSNEWIHPPYSDIVLPGGNEYV